MHLYAPERPQASPGKPALLVDGSAVPVVYCMPQEDGTVMLSVMLSNYDGNNSYSYHHCELAACDLGDFFLSYRIDPEQELERSFDWRPQARAKAMPNNKREVREAQQYVESLL